MSIKHADLISFHERQAKLQAEAGAAFASELTATTDTSRRDLLMQKAAKAKEQAKFHRDTASSLRADG